MRAKAFVVSVALATVTGVGITHAQTELRVPAGRSVTGKLEGLSAQFKTVSGPRVLELEFGRRTQGKFVAYAKDQPMSFDLPFLVRVRYDVEPVIDRTEITLTWGAGQSRKVPIRKTEANRTVFESAEMFFEDPRTCTGLQFCQQSERLSHAP
jgi:hypothetical protein